MVHRPRKRFGQNFLQDNTVIAAILRGFNPQPEERVVEIGPGLGALTKPLLQRLHALTAIEIDTDLHAHLHKMPEASGKLTLVQADALKVDFSTFGTMLRVIGNLPYNISTPLIIRLLRQLSCIHDMCFMLQKEVVERLCALPGCKDYGRLSVMVQYHCEAVHLFDVPPEAFYPQPKVDSAIVLLTPHVASPYPDVCFNDLERVVAQAFSMRRKTLANTLKPLMQAADLSALGIDPSVRPEQVSVQEYARIVKFITK